MTSPAPQKEYAECLCPSCYVLSCANRKKPKGVEGLIVLRNRRRETHFEEIDSF